MGVYMSPEELKAAARANDTNTAVALKAAQEAVAALLALRESMIFGLSPAGRKTDMVFGKASTVVDELITEVDKAITVLTQNLHLSANLVVKNQEDAQIDFDKLARDNRHNVKALDTTGIRPGDETYQHPTPANDSATGRSAPDAGTPATASTGQQSTSGDSGN
jgi:hypothetical protein